MAGNKAAKLWFVNIISFIHFSVLVATGLTNWLLIPRGFRSESGFLISLRHFIRDVHQWVALAFIVIILIHLALHWPYIKSNLKK